MWGIKGKGLRGKGQVLAVSGRRLAVRTIFGWRVAAPGGGLQVLFPGPAPEPEHPNLIPDGQDLIPENALPQPILRSPVSLRVKTFASR